ncbi:hypothetical protein A3C37_03185 [Candidatus Peribacteria bacterium RIFCSPHIGHO2_02_FULL_53_20]|nr:MAG: hypothetical protein A3C37_03185 [Candidatus Peribacteria bacterium RIFCSPHIGHO2_02_FULL_53_20]OGJ72483.1 MAG: hypothetical protein A3G69_01235 [Candidatus Peribacteria bacterium RIFCSPLOWO2_12_FULL_53_10]
MLSALLDALFPKKSLSGGEGEWVTGLERSQLRSFPVVESTPQLRAQGIHHLDRLVSGSNYHECPLLKNAIWIFKFRRIPALGEELAKIMLVSNLFHNDASVLVPVPLHWSRRFWRGFNQSEILARIISQQCSIPMRSCLCRIRPTGFQSHRARRERLTALEGAFRALGPIPERVVLIDDIATTGATLDACAKTLKKAGAKWVEGWVVARG